MCDLQCLYTNILSSVVFIFGYSFVWFIYALVKKRNDVADVAWGLGFVFLSILMMLSHLNFTSRAIIVLFLVFLWGLRLAVHIYQRNKGLSEDKRYKQWREDWGNWFVLRSYLQIFLLQGLLAIVVMLPVLNILTFPKGRLNVLDFIGITIWIVGFIFEVLGDYQLSKFLSQPANKGEVLNTGLWKYTRHPNYFGEVTMWWGLFIISLNVPLWYISIIGPITISFLILFVSGVPMLERSMAKKQKYQEYMKQTSKFFPWFPNK